MRRLCGLGAVLLALGGVGVLAPSASATPLHLSVSWQVPGSATAGRAVPFSWTAKHVSRRGRLVVQRQMGTARVWRAVVRLPVAARGVAQLPGLPLGIYRFRLVVVVPHRRTLILGQRSIAFFGTVPFARLFQDYDMGSGTYTSPTRTFDYVLEDVAAGNGNSRQIGVQGNPCRSVHIDFIGGDQTGDPQTNPQSPTVSVIQATRDPVRATVPLDTIGALDAPLVPGQSWTITVDSGGPESMYVYFNGSASCDSDRPLTLPSS